MNLKKSFRTLQYWNYIYCARRNGLPLGCVKGTNEIYLFDIDDYEIPHSMWRNQATFSENEMLLFISLLREKCDISLSDAGLFFDIGANIGTTSIWISKHVIPTPKIVAFEPDPNNFHLLKTNAILNRCDLILENIGVSNEDGKKMMRMKKDNRGGNRIIDDAEAICCERDVEWIQLTSIDSYCRRKKIDIQSIQAMWIDVEGHEPQVLAGMRHALSQKRIPLFMEFTPRFMKEEDFESALEILKSTYTICICIQTSNQSYAQHNISYLSDLYYKQKDQYNVFLC